MIIAWDLDGVINDSFINGRYKWLDKLAQSYGFESDGFASFVFQRPNWDNIIIGSQDVRDRICEWLKANGRNEDVDDIISCWHHGLPLRGGPAMS